MEGRHGDGTRKTAQHGLLPAGLHPDPEWAALEHIYILEGEALWENGGRQVLLGPGDSLSASPVKEPFVLVARTRLVFLYITSQPAFHLVSQEVSHLQQLAVSVDCGVTRFPLKPRSWQWLTAMTP